MHPAHRSAAPPDLYMHAQFMRVFLGVSDPDNTIIVIVAARKFLYILFSTFL